MAAVSGCAAPFAGPKAVPFLRRYGPYAPFSATFSGFRIGPVYVGNRRGALRRSPRCEAGVDLVEERTVSRASSVSALEQFKISADRKSFLVPHFCFWYWFRRACSKS